MDNADPFQQVQGFPWVFQVAWRTFSKRDLNGPDPKTDDECLIRTAIMSPRRLFSFLLSWLPASCSTQPLATAVSNRLPTAGSLPCHNPSAGLLAGLAHCVFLQPLSPNCSLARPAPAKVDANNPLTSSSSTSVPPPSSHLNLPAGNKVPQCQELGQSSILELFSQLSGPF